MLYRFEWGPKYMLGNEMIDQQHKYLFDLGNQLQDASLKESKDILQLLLKYCKIHFKQEEKHMREHQYPDFTEHQQRHINILKELDYYSDGGLNDQHSLQAFTHFFMSWLSVHVLKEDMAYVKFCASQASPAPVH
jgi:hemerythrin